jgi:hypothetical protein
VFANGYIPSASTKIGVVIGVTFVFVVVTATPFKVSFPITLCCYCGATRANGAGVPKVSFPAMILPTTFTVSVAVVQFDGLTLTPVVVSDSQMVYR